MVETAVSPSRTGRVAPVRTNATATLVIGCAAVLLVLLAYNAPLAAVPQMAASLGAGMSGQTWIMNGMVLGLAVSMLIAGSVADDYGRRRVFLIGTGLFAASLAAGVAAPSTALFVVLRVLQGLGAAAMLTASTGLIVNAHPVGPGRVRAIGLWSAMIGLGIAVGPLVSASLATAWSWRACYGIYAVAALAIVVATPRLVPESRAEHRQTIDVPGVVTLAAGMALLLTALTEARSGWLRPEVAILFGGAAVVLAGFVVIEWRRRAPMLDPRLFRSPAFVVATIGALVTGLAVIGFVSYLPTVFQRSLGMSALSAVAPVVVWAGVSFLVSLQARRLAVAARWQIAAGLALAAVAYAVMLGAVDAGAVGRLYAGFVISGVGSGLINASLARMAVESVPAGRGSMGAGANQTARYLGSSAGLAITVVLATSASGGGPAHALAHGTDIAMIVALALTVAGALTAAVVRPRTA
ncbi:MAG TPA: MFS transporter [Streptosporangiaceae bacterium]|jgi:MFS family permease